ncbi:MAG: hypothetical protein AAB964_01450, partial [Patescibacteria group bacterium]
MKKITAQKIVRVLVKGVLLCGIIVVAFSSFINPIPEVRAEVYCTNQYGVTQSYPNGRVCSSVASGV